MKAVFSPGPSYFDPNVRQYAGWVKILDLYKEGLEELGYDVFVPEVDPELIDQASTVSKILSYDIVAAAQLRDEGFDIPYSSKDLFLGPPGYSLAQMMAIGAGIKTFLYVWNNADWWRDQQLAEEYKKLGAPYDLSPTWRWINRTALEMCDHVIACSPFVKKTHAEVVPEDKISIAFWGVDSEKFQPGVEEPPGYKILFVGGDPVRKGLYYLAKAIEEMKGCELWIVGCRPFADGKDVFQTTSGVTVRQFGMLPHEDMARIYKLCHVICIPTLEDGIALAMQEGMACGLVPIGTPDVAEVFAAHEIQFRGYKVDFKDIGAIRRALTELKENPEQRRLMSKLARAITEAQTWEQTKEEFKEIIRCQMS